MTTKTKGRAQAKNATPKQQKHSEYISPAIVEGQGCQGEWRHGLPSCAKGFKKYGSYDLPESARHQRRRLERAAKKAARKATGGTL